MNLKCFYLTRMKNTRRATRYVVTIVLASVLLNGGVWMYSRRSKVIDCFDYFKGNVLGVFQRLSCEPYKPDGLQVINFEKPELPDLQKSLPQMQNGGSWMPENCKPLYPKIDLIIPFRNREDHLMIFLNYIHKFLQKQQVPYTVYVIEQAPKSQFNRGMLLNIGYLESQNNNHNGLVKDKSAEQHKSNCVIFHDVDLLPEDDRNVYTCSEGSVRHLSAHVDEFAYRLPYNELVGGAVSFTRNDFYSINGFSNRFFGWGGEDDDLYNRIKYHGLNITRYQKNISRYKMLRHRKIYPNKDRFKYIQTGDRRFLTDGLNNIEYVIRGYKKTPLYTWICVEIVEPSSRMNL